MPIGMSDEESMMPSLYEFFSIECNFDIIKEFINSRKSRTNKLSFGLLDWFNVNYAKEYGVDELENEHEERLEKDHGPVFFLENFPERTSPFWNMKLQEDKEHSNKIDVINRKWLVRFFI